MKKSLVIVTMILAGCGTGASQKQQATSPAPQQGEVEEAAGSTDQILTESQAPKYFIAVTDKNGNIISARATDDEGVSGSAEQVAQYETSQASVGAIQGLQGDNTTQDGSTQSWHGGGTGWHGGGTWHGGGHGYYWGGNWGRGGFGYYYAPSYYPTVVAPAYDYGYAYPSYTYGAYSIPYYPSYSYSYGGAYYSRWNRGGYYYNGGHGGHGGGGHHR